MSDSKLTVEHRIFGAPLRYIQGAGAIHTVGKTARMVGTHALLIGDQLVLDLVGSTLAHSCHEAGIELTQILFTGEVTPAEIERLKAQPGIADTDVVLAAGGGKGIDIGKALANSIGAQVITVPTIASNDAPTSKIYVVYDENHRLLAVEHMNHNPFAVIVDTDLIARAPRVLLLAGIGDAISKKFEVAQCFNAKGKNIYGGLGTAAANALASTCYELIREHSVSALHAVDTKKTNLALESLVEATVLLSGLCFENGGLSIAHAMTRGLSAVRETAHALHGLQVAYGLLVQFILEERSDDFISDMVAFYKETGLPRSLQELGLPHTPTDDEIQKIAELTMTAPHVRNFPTTLTSTDLMKAIQSVQTQYIN